MSQLRNRKKQKSPPPSPSHTATAIADDTKQKKTSKIKNRSNNHKLLSAPSPDPPTTIHSPPTIQPHRWCEICGKEFPFVDNPLEQEHIYMLHFASEHLLDEMKEGRISCEDVEALESYMEGYSTIEAEMKDAWNEVDLAKYTNDLVLAETKEYYVSVERRKFWFAICTTICIFLFVWYCQFTGE